MPSKRPTDETPVETQQKRARHISTEACVVCCEREPCMLIRECKHVCLCVNCSFGVFVINKSCPMCRSLILTAPIHMATSDPESEKLSSAFVSDVILTANRHVEKGCTSEKILGALDGIMEYISENDMRRIVRAYKVYSETLISAIVELAMTHSSNESLQMAVVYECDRSEVCGTGMAVSTLMDPRCSEPLAQYCLRLLECGTRDDLSKPSPDEVFGALTAITDRFQTMGVLSMAVVTAAVVSTKCSLPPGALWKFAKRLHDAHRGDTPAMNRLCQFFGTVTFATPEPLETWKELASLAMELLRSEVPSIEGARRVIRFLVHAAVCGSGSWDTLAESGGVAACVEKARVARDVSIDKWIMAMGEKITTTKVGCKAFIDAGGLDHLVSTMGGELSNDQSSVRKFARIVKTLSSSPDVQKKKKREMMDVMIKVCKNSRQAESWTTAWDLVEDLKERVT